MRDLYTTALMTDIDAVLAGARKAIRERIEARGCSEFRPIRVSEQVSTEGGIMVQIDEALSRIYRRGSDEDVADLFRLVVLMSVHRIREGRAR